MRLPLLAASALSLAFLTAAPAAAQRQTTPEQRIERLERQVRQMGRQVFPKGQPADTAGFNDAPAATQDSVTGLLGRVDALERQMAELVRASEENGNRLSVIEADIARLRAEQQARPGFDLRDFHDKVLVNGSVPLAVLEALIRA